MRIPFPKAIPLVPAVLVLSAVLFIQIFQGTDPLFSVLMMGAQLAAVEAFNLLGGMTHVAGAFCLLMLLPNVTVPEITHIVLGQPGDYNLQHPLMTAAVCAVFFACILVSALLLSSISHPVALLSRIEFSILELRTISALCAILAISVSFTLIIRNAPAENGTLLAALNHFIGPLSAASIMLATYVRIVTTNGRSVVSWYIVTLLFLSIVPGLLNASKEGMLTPLLSWVLVVASSQHRFTWWGTLGLATVLFAVWTFVYPFSQNARVEIRDADSLSDKANLIVQFFTDPTSFPDSISNFDESSEFGTASSKVNIVKRYSLLKTNDMMIDADQRSGYTSINRYLPVLLSVVPHALWPDRPDPIFSNELGHKAGVRMGDDDTTTGISLGAPGLYFDLGGWVGLIVYTLICFTMFFFVMIRFIGSSARGVWGLIPIGVFANAAGSATPGALFSYLYGFTLTLFVMIVALKIVGYVTGTLISRPVTT